MEDTGFVEAGNVEDIISESYYSLKTESFKSNTVSESEPYNITEEGSSSIKNYDKDANNWTMRTQSHIPTHVVTDTIGSKPIFKRQKDENDRSAHFAKRFCSRSLKHSRNANNVNKFDNVVSNNIDKVMLHVKNGLSFNFRQTKRKRENSLSDVDNENETDLLNQTNMGKNKKRLKFTNDERQPLKLNPFQLLNLKQNNSEF